MRHPFRVVGKAPRDYGTNGQGGRCARSASGKPMRMRMRLLALFALVPMLLGGCGFGGVYEMPLPGGADLGGDPYRVRVQFADVLDLVPNAGVRVNDVPVGRVEKIGLEPGSWEAEVTVLVNSNVKLPENATARLRQSSLLGEKYVELSDPPSAWKPHGELVDGSVIPIERTNRNPQVEEVLGALSLLLNGGAVGQLQNITEELNAALEGRESDARSLLSNVDELVSGLDAQRNDITRALDGVNRLSASLNAQREDIDTALRDLQPGLKVLNDQRDQLVTMLQSLDKLSQVGTDVINKSKDDLVNNLRALAPTLRNLAKAGDSLPKSLQLLLTYPFTDQAIEAIHGDYANLFIDADLNLTNILGNIGRSKQPIIHPPKLPLPFPPQSQQPSPTPETEKPQPPPEEDDSSGGLLDFLFGGD